MLPCRRGARRRRRGRALAAPQRHRRSARSRREATKSASITVACGVPWWVRTITRRRVSVVVVVARLDTYLRIGDGRLQRPRSLAAALARTRSIATPASSAYSAAGSTSAREPLDHRLGQQVFARDAFERLGGERRLAGARHQLRALERDLQQVLLQLVVVLEIGLFLALLRPCRAAAARCRCGRARPAPASGGRRT